MNIWNYLYARRLPLLILVSLLVAMLQLGIIRSMLAALVGELHVFAVSMATYIVLFLIVSGHWKRER